MSDVIPCPECNGKGETRIGKMRFGCPLCHSTGEVGGDHEPAEMDDRPIDVDPMDATPAHEQDGWALAGCTTCGGSGEVLSLGGAVRGGQARRGARIPCPSCRTATA